MTSTTIKVSSDLRDRMKAHAAADGPTLGAHLERLTRREDRRRRFESMRSTMAATPPELLASYAAESAQWHAIDDADWPQE